jgi:PAS domain S-box-containing protein
MTQATHDPNAVAAALADPAFCALANGPVLVAGGAPVRILYASEPLLALFGVHDLDALNKRIFDGSEPGARRLADLAANLPQGQPRLERLRFYVSGVSEAITFQCKQVAGASNMFVAAAIGVRPALLTRAPARTPSLATNAPLTLTPLEAASAEVTAPAQTAAPDPHPAPRAAEIRPTGSVRFLWKSDADVRFTSFDRMGSKALGVEPDALLGRSVLELAGLPGFDPDGRLCAALMRRETWSGIEVNWPIGDGDEAAPVVMGGLPVFNRERVFTGYSGFGVVHLDRATKRVLPVNDATAADIAEETAPQAPFEIESMELAEVQSALGADVAQIADMTTLADMAASPAVTPEAEATTQAEMAQIAADIVEPSLFDVLEAEDGAAGSPTESDADLNDDHIADSPVERTFPQLEFASRPTTPAIAAFTSQNVVALNAWKTGGAQPAAPQALAAPPSEATAREAPVREAPANEAREFNPKDEFPSREGEEEELVRLTPTERHAFREIARALGARIEDAEKRRVRRDERETDERKAEPPRTPLHTEAERAARSPERPAERAPAFTAPIPSHDAASRKLLDRVDAALMVCSEGEAVFLNKQLLETLGYDSFADFSSAGGVTRMFRRRAPDVATSGGAVPVARRDGEIVALEGKLTTIEWDGAPAMLTTFRRPADTELNTRYRALELDLRAREAEGRELHAILDTATDGVAILDGDGRILGLNRSAEALFGYEQNEVAGESYTILFATESHPAAIDYLSGLKTNGVRSVLNDGREVMGRARQGGVLPVFMTIGRIGVEPASKFCVVMRDMTQWKNAERDLKDARRTAEEASALKSDFLAKISHEIRTPLNAIIGFTEVILEERFGPIGNDRYKDYLKDIHASGALVMSLVNDLLDLSKIEAGKLELNFGSVDANRVINESVSMMQAQAIRERVIIRLSLAPQFPNIVADERALRQIVLNLLSNAVKFNQPGGQVIVSTALTDAGAAVLRVRDNGVGMTEKEVEIALEPFRQIQTSRHTKGTGLGLPLTKALVEANRAAFSIRSRKDEGTLVEVSFPSTRVLAE